MVITFDSAKDARNRRRHGISLQRAEAFHFDSAFVLLDDSQDYGETRYNAIGFLDARLFSLTFTMRADDTELRAISLRQATASECKIYAS